MIIFDKCFKKYTDLPSNIIGLLSVYTTLNAPTSCVTT